MKPDALRRLAAAGLDAEQIAIVMEVMDDEAEDRRAKGRARWRKHQENKRNANVSSLQETFTANSREGVTRVEDKPLTKQTNTVGKKDNSASDVDAFKGALAPLLDSERLEAIVKHRKARKAPVTGHAAKVFLGDIERAGISVSEAVDHCISRNWLTVKPSWVSEQQPRAGPAKPITLADRSAQLAQEFANARNLRPSESSRSLQPALPDLSVISGGRGG